MSTIRPSIRECLPKMASAALVSCLVLGAHAPAGAQEAELVRGGKLYDKWYKVIEAPAPQKSHALYPSDKKYADNPGANWRCKECHGWDYMGKDGAYSKGKHHSGIAGIKASAGADPAKVAAILKGEPHGFGGLMPDADIDALAMFVTKGQVYMDAYIDRGSKLAKGDAARGRNYYETLCAQCHGADGKLVNGMDPMGALVKGNPWENLHKILNGQPAEEMPALRALDIQVTARKR